MSSTYECTVGIFTRGLNSLNSWIYKAEELAKTKKFDTDVFVQARLAPDMYPFLKQVQIACDAAKGAAARLVGKQPPKHEDNERTFADLHKRIEKTVEYLKTLKPNEFDGCDDRRVNLPWPEGKWMYGGQYIPQMAIPNFYFHLTTAYTILRHNGVDVGKTDFLGKIDLQS